MQSPQTQIAEGQELFDKRYITATQIMQDLQLTRANLSYARRTGKLPAPIVVNDGRLLLWEREQIQTYLDAWKVMLNARRGV